ncbi:hypothetical protein HDU97_009136 [Phlyctochytrium planicorne]|nr:hypothetical protein HDU97_009136 [Phlyctochytrium planicorne]
MGPISRLTLCGLAFAQSNSDACAKLSQRAGTIVTVDETFSCYNSFSISASTKKKQIESLKSYFELYESLFRSFLHGPPSLTALEHRYPYLDLAKSSNAPLYPSQVDLFGELDRIANDPAVVTEYDFHSRVSDLVSSLNDAHSYYQPICYTAVRFFQPWVISARYPAELAGKPELYLKSIVTEGSFTFSDYSRKSNPFLGKYRGEYDQYWNRALGVNPKSYVGYAVVEIDGQDSLVSFFGFDFELEERRRILTIAIQDYVQSYGDRLSGVSRVADTRFNYVLPSMQFINGTMRMADSLLYRITWAPSDLKPTRTYKLKGPKGDEVEVNAPWGGYVRPPLAFSDRDSFYRTLCTGKKNPDDPNIVVPPLPEASSSSAQVGEESSSSTPGLRRRRHVRRGGAVEQATDALIKSVSLIVGAGAMGENKRKVTTGGPLPSGPVQFVDDVSFNTKLMMNPDVDWDLTASTVSAAIDKFNLGTKGGFQKWLKAAGGVPTNRALDLSKPIVSDMDSAFYLLDSKTGVWVFQTVSPTDSSSQGIAGWLSTIVSGLQALDNAGVENLIIDVSRNGGGIVCAGHALIQYLFPKATFVNYDVRLTESLNFLMRNADASVSSGISGDSIFSAQELSSAAADNSSNIFDPGNKFVRGGTESTYSNRFEFVGCKNFAKRFLGKVPPLKKGWYPSDVVILSDGMCGSTCAESFRTLRDQFKVRSAVFGGRTATPFQPTSFEGGVVVSFSDILTDSTNIVTHTETLRPVAGIPQRFPLPAEGTVPIWESYSPNAPENVRNFPAEFVPQPAEVFVAPLDPLDKVALWGLVAKGLESAKKNEGEAAGDGVE